jgi:hypothetical protein
MFDEFKELLSIFNARNVRYLVVGGYAVSLHAQPRSTQDIDILIACDAKNAEAIYASLEEFGAPPEGLKPVDFTVAGEIPGPIPNTEVKPRGPIVLHAKVRGRVGRRRHK